MDNPIPLLWRTLEFQRDDKDIFWWIGLTLRRKNNYAKKVLPRYVSKECPMCCLFCSFVEGIEYGDIPNRCGKKGQVIETNDVCYLFTPDDHLNELWTGYDTKPRKEAKE